MKPSLDGLIPLGIWTTHTYIDYCTYILILFITSHKDVELSLYFTSRSVSLKIHIALSVVCTFEFISNLYSSHSLLFFIKGLTNKAIPSPHSFLGGVNWILRES